MATFQRIALFLTIIGALNWGCVGLFQFDPIATLFQGSDSLYARIIYVIVGLAGLVNIALLWADFPEKKPTQNNADTSISASS